MFVKHPFDVGDRVRIYGNTGTMMQGDDYYVIEVSLLYTEFKKMEGHIVQAPNSVLNNLFILNQRRSQGLADPINLKLRFGTTEAQIEELKARMLQFCLANQRDYAPRIISEVQTIDEVYSITMNIIFFHKSNYQNELLRLTRHNRFAVELMHQMRDMGLEGPRVQQPGGLRDMPLYWSQVQQPPQYTAAASGGGGGGAGPGPAVPVPVLHHSNSVHNHGTPTGPANDAHHHASQFSPTPMPSLPGPMRRGTTRASGRARTDSLAAVVESGMDFQDVYENRRQEGGASIARLPSAAKEMRQMDEAHAALASGVDEGGAALEKAPSRESAAASVSTRRRNLWGLGSGQSRGGRNAEERGVTGSNAV